jgi:hypothetical protein
MGSVERFGEQEKGGVILVNCKGVKGKLGLLSGINNNLK